MYPYKLKLLGKPMSSNPRKGAAPAPPMAGGVKVTSQAPPTGSEVSAPDLHKQNGSGPLSLTYSGEHEDDENMNEVNEDTIVELNVILPNGKSRDMEVDANIPMIDLLVHLAGRARLNPAGHKLVVINEETGRNVDYKANQTVGSLGISTIHLVDKKAVSEKNKKNVHINPATKQEQPFEMTYRLTINLPRNQKSVIRINPKTPLHQLFRTVCEDKNIDPARYTFQHPAKPDHPLDPRMTVGDLHSNEINLVPASLNKAKRSRSFLAPVPDQAQSMPDLRRSESSRVAAHDQSMPTYMPGSGPEKKKSRIFSFFKKEKKFKPVQHGAPYAETPPGASQPRTTGSPPLRRSGEAPKQERPKTMYAGMLPEENGHIQIQSPSNGQLPQGMTSTPTSSQTLGRPAKKPVVASPPGQSGEVVSQTLPRPASAVKSPQRGHGKKRPAPPPPQQAPSPQSTSGPQPSPSQPHTPSAPAPAPIPSAQTLPTPTESPAPSPAEMRADKTVNHLTEVKSESKAQSNIPVSLSQDRISSPETSDVSTAGKDMAESEIPKAEASSVVGTQKEISVSVETDPTKRPHEHSRTSSDSSGYHEATLSGPESPEANRPSSSLQYNKDNSMDSESIESAETPNPAAAKSTATTPLNIPSLRSQMRSRDAELDSHVIPGEFVTLPRKHADKKAKDQREVKEGLQRSHSLEKENKSAPGPVPQRRRKAPAPPPPSAADSPRKVDHSNTSSAASTPPSARGQSREVIEVEMSRGEVKGERSPEVSDLKSQPEPLKKEIDVQVMTEEAKVDTVTSEGKETTPPNSDLQRRPSRADPPLFIAPPPPDTPPPPDASYQNAALQTEDKAPEETTNTEEGGHDTSVTSEGAELNNSLTAESITSLKSSPTSTQSRSESRASKTSISTIDDVNLAFDETIALAEAVLGRTSEEGGLAPVRRLSENEDASKSPQDRVTGDRSDKGDPDDVFNQNFKDKKARSGSGREVQDASSSDWVEVSRSSEGHRQSDPSVSEITYDFKVDAVPPGFTGDNVTRQSTSEEEEEITIIEEEVVFTGPSALIQSYKDDAKKNEAWQKDLEESMSGSVLVPGATVPNWDTSAEPEPIPDTIVHAKMVMVEPEREVETRAQPELESSRFSAPENEESRHEEVPVERPSSPVAVCNENDTHQSVVNGYDEDARRSTVLRYVRDEAGRTRARRQPRETGEKEEFVFSKEDLNKIDFLGGRKPKKPAVRLPVAVATPAIRSNVNTGTYTAPVLDSRGNVSGPQYNQGTAKPSKPFMVPQPYKQPSGRSDRGRNSPYRSTEDLSWDRQSSSSGRGSNKANIRSDMNFPPTTESEAENVLEEKSISMIALPALRVSSSSSDRRVTSMSASEARGQNVTSTSSVRLSDTSRSENPSYPSHKHKGYSSRSSSQEEAPSAPAPTHVNQDGGNTEQQELANAQYNQLQSQFALWQQQLAQNQALLAQHKIMPEDQNQQLQQLRMQLQMQQQMMEQLQQSMQALAMQGATAGAPPTVQAMPVQPVNSAPPPAPIVPQAPSAPPVPSAPVAVPKAEQKTNPKPKNKKRFERQLDPREELMLAIRQASGRNCLKKVTVKEARWTNRYSGGEQQ